MTTSIKFMRCAVLTVVFCTIAFIMTGTAIVYPAWIQQTYRPREKQQQPKVFQSFGLFAFYSTNALTNPFYASHTTLFYSDFCSSQNAGGAAPNWMLGQGSSFEAILCSTTTTVIQYAMLCAALFAGLSIIAAILACYTPVAGYAERAVSATSFFSSICLLLSLIIWSVYFEGKFLNIDVIMTAYSQCHTGEIANASWSCWFYGDCFWVTVAAVFVLFLATYTNAASRHAKIRHAHEQYQTNLGLAMHESSVLNNLTSNNNIQPLLSPSYHDKALMDAQLELALQQSLAQHQLEQAIAASHESLNDRSSSRYSRGDYSISSVPRSSDDQLRRTAQSREQQDLDLAIQRSKVEQRRASAN